MNIVLICLCLTLSQGKMRTIQLPQKFFKQAEGSHVENGSPKPKMSYINLLPALADRFQNFGELKSI